MLRTAVSLKPATIVLDQEISIVGGVCYQAGIEFYPFHCLAVTFHSNNRNTNMIRTVELYFAKKLMAVEHIFEVSYFIRVSLSGA